MANLGGHDLPTLLDAFERVDHDRPIVLHRLHDQGLRPAAGRPQGQSRRLAHRSADGGLSQTSRYSPRPRVGPFRGPADRTAGQLERFLAAVPFNQEARAAIGRRASNSPTACTAPKPKRRCRRSRVSARSCSISPRPTALWPTASSPRRPMSRCRPISAAGSIAAACSPATSSKDLFKAERIPSTYQLGVLAAKASISNSASPR